MRRMLVWTLATLAACDGCRDDDPQEGFTTTVDAPEAATPAAPMPPTAAAAPDAEGLELGSPAVEDGGPIPPKYTCEGADERLPLTWGAPPAEARSFALIVDDPDAPGAEPFVHYLAWGIPADARSLPAAGAIPEGRNGFDKTGWGGPCPPPAHEAHHYHFRLYALDRAIDLPAGAQRSALEEAMKGHVVAQDDFVATFDR